MKKTVMIAVIGMLMAAGLKAQSIQEGINHLYADRFKTAVSVFEKLIAANPNNTDAIYWLGQTYLDDDKNDLARQLYDKALATSNNAPLVLVGRGHVDLHDKKLNEARQKFEQAITMTRGKKGDDPAILGAIGRANVDAKAGDLAYAIEKLKAAIEKDQKSPDLYMQLGNAYRKAKPGEGGGDAYVNYNKALEVNPNFVVAYIRLAKLFEAQKNWELVLQNLNASVAKDPSFTLGYYELFYYNFFRQRFPEAEEFLKKYINSKASENDIQDQYLYAQLCWAKKDYACATSKAESVTAAMGAATKPKVLKLLADAYLQKGDSINAKKYVDQYFAKEKPEDFIGFDYALKADIYSKFPGQEAVVFDSYLEGVKIDTVLDNKVEILKKGAEFFRKRNEREKEGDLMVKLLEIKPKPSINDYFDAGRAYYFGKQYAKSRDLFTTFIQKYPDEVYGYEWVFNNSKVIDTLKKDSIAVPDALKLFDFSAKDTTKFKRQYISAASYLAIYYANDAKDKDKAIEYLKKWQEADTANAEAIQKNIDILQKSGKSSPGPRGNSTPRAGSKKPSPNSKPGSSIKQST
ncbi:MAG TPA: tetratricopeptide repeat protein [Chitinophagaceae bacterium]|nr:tetratricopeptide repeat protein [Chitinophagaceae bacterium]